MTGLLRSLAVVAPMLAAVSLLVFALLHAAPGDPARLMLGNRPATEETLAAIRAKHHLDQSLPAQYWHWLSGAVRGDFGDSISTRQDALGLTLDHLSISLQLGLFAFVITVAFGVPLGLLAALRRGRAVDRLISGIAIAGASAPGFVTSLMLIYVFAVRLRWFASYGEGDGGWDRITHLTLPALALSASVVALIVKLTRSAVLEVLEQDFITFGRARGLTARRILVSYVLRNALMQVVTAAGLVLGYLVTGAVLVEVTFDVAGIGVLLVDAVNSKDIPVVQCVTVIVAVVIIGVNLATDRTYHLIDPRIRRARVR